MQWEPVQYFNNKIICDLVEEKFKGIISILVRRGGVADVPKGSKAVAQKKGLRTDVVLDPWSFCASG